MATILPFKGLLYNPDRVKGDEVIAPPYDIISSEYKETLYKKSPYNIVRVDFGKELPDDTEENNKYTRAGNSFEQWIREGILVRDEKPSFYAYEIDYRVAGEEKTLRGILARVKLEELGKSRHSLRLIHRAGQHDDARFRRHRMDHLHIQSCLALPASHLLIAWIKRDTSERGQRLELDRR